MTNEELVARFQNGEDVFDELYHQNSGFIYKMAYECSRKSRLEKDDLVSDFMYVLYRCAGAYDLNADNKFVTFFGTAMTRSFSKSVQRSEYANVYTKTSSLNVPLKTSSSATGTPPEVIDLIPSHHEEFTYREEIERLCYDILQQSFSRRVANMIIEYLLSDATYRELGEKYGVSYQAVSLNVKRARAVLKTELRKQNVV